MRLGKEGVCLARIEGRQNLRMLRVGGCLDFSQESLGSDKGREPTGEWPVIY